MYCFQMLSRRWTRLPRWLRNHFNRLPISCSYKFNESTNFINYCNGEILEKRCQRKQDCVYSNSCKNGYCAIDYSDLGKQFLKCGFKFMVLFVNFRGKMFVPSFNLILRWQLPLEKVPVLTML